ncbi:unnamed protein product [Lactuca saligna]|uniref:Bifunctional inhibitor/plant lipid transfer protein/seed storage helical domain-containing protein n=1 Tax=Lactuca saligna TaxID=75948 RepID=A0AA35YYK5_LACSI|nr:unnamed protein product [Lactuca saligna]
MENSLRRFMVVVIVLLISTGHVQLAQTTCDPVQLSWCLQAIVSYQPPSADCCLKLKSQESCLCQETTDPTFGGYLCLPGAKMVATACGVAFNYDFTSTFLFQRKYIGASFVFLLRLLDLEST